MKTKIGEDLENSNATVIVNEDELFSIIDEKIMEDYMKQSLSDADTESTISLSQIDFR